MAIDFNIEQRICRPREDVFDFVTNPARLPEWDRRVVATEILNPVAALAVGTRIREWRAVGGRRIPQVVEVSAYERPSRFGLAIVEGPVPIDGDLSFEAVAPRQTLVRLHAHGRLSRQLRWAEPLVAAMGRREMRRQYRQLAAVLEGNGFDATPQAPPGAFSAGERA